MKSLGKLTCSTKISEVTAFVGVGFVEVLARAVVGVAVENAMINTKINAVIFEDFFKKCFTFSLSFQGNLHKVAVHWYL